MSDLPPPSAARRVLPAASPSRRTVLRASGAAAGLVTALAVTAGVLLPPGGSGTPAAAHPRPTVSPTPVPAADGTLPKASSAAPERGGAPAVAEPRDPFRPLLTAPAATSAAPAASASTRPAPPAVPSVPLATGVSAPRAAAPTTTSPAVPAPTAPAPTAPTPTITAPAAPRPVAPPSSDSPAPARRLLALTRVEAAGGSFVAVLTLDGAPVRVRVGETFGPGGGLRLVSLQQGPAAGQWTAVVQVGSSQPFDVVTGTPVPLP